MFQEALNILFIFDIFAKLFAAIQNDGSNKREDVFVC